MAHSEQVLPRYPIYIPSKNRYEKNRALTANCLIRDGVPFYLVVEPKQQYHYAAVFGKERLLVLPRDDMRLIGARNWIKDHAVEEGHERHWQIDDNVRMFYRWYRRKRIPCRAGIALQACEEFTDRYENIAISGLNYLMFGVGNRKPFDLNCHVYSCTLINNAIPHRWRLVYNDDVDICLQVLADGWCTVLVNAFLAEKIWTMKIPGGNTQDLYQGDGRLKMARMLERNWPGVVDVRRRFQRPQHVVKDAWRKFDTPLRLKPGLSLEGLAEKGPGEYGMELREVKEVKSERLKALAEEYNRGQRDEPGADEAGRAATRGDAG